MDRIHIVLLATCLVLVAGCSDEETFSRYPSVSVPEYAPEDYLRDLASPDPELVYNAICNLGRTAGQFSKTLCAEEANPTSPEYQSADEVYRAVCRQLESKESYTVAASLRFLQVFAKNYKPKEELVEIVSRIESHHPQVQFEQATLLNSVVRESSRLPEPLLRRLLESPSWIVSRTTYGLVGRLHEEPLRQELAQRYQATDTERERLILIVALSQRMEPEEARLLEEEMFATEKPRIRHAIGRTLMQNLNVPEVKQWFQDHFMQLNDKEKKNLFTASFGNCSEADIDFACQLLSQGYIPDDEFLKELAAPPSDDEKEDERAELLRFEEAILANPQLAGRWQTMKDEAEQEQLRKNALREEMAPLSKEFISEIKVVLMKHEIPASDQKNALEKLGKALSPLTGEE